MKFRSRSVSPFPVTWFQLCTSSVSARARSRLSSQFPIFSWAGEPGTRGPKATWPWIYAKAAEPENSWGGRAFSRQERTERREQAHRTETMERRMRLWAGVSDCVDAWNVMDNAVRRADRVTGNLRHRA